MVPRKLLVLLSGALILLSPVSSPAADSVTLTEGESAFIELSSREILAAYPTSDAAIRSGYFAFTGEDERGVILYARLPWDHQQASSPSQLWYDIGGHLVGATYVVPSSKATPPTLFPVGTSRWFRLVSHVHYGLAAPGGATIYNAIGTTMLNATDGVDQPLSSLLVKAGVAKTAAEIRFAFQYPTSWNLSFWILPNPNGPFAQMNPAVHPSAHASAVAM